MAYDRAFGDWVREHFAALGPLEIKPMFGAASVYANGLIWALLDEAWSGSRPMTGTRRP